MNKKHIRVSDSMLLAALLLGTGCTSMVGIDQTPSFEPPPIRTPVAARDRSAVVGKWKGSSIMDNIRKSSRMTAYIDTEYDFKDDGTYQMKIRTKNVTETIVGVGKMKQTAEMPTIVTTGTWTYENGVITSTSYNETLKRALTARNKTIWYGDDEMELLPENEEELEKAVSAGVEAGKAVSATNGGNKHDIQTFSKRQRDEHGVTTTTMVTMMDGKQIGEPSVYVSSPTILSRIR